MVWSLTMAWLVATGQAWAADSEGAVPTIPEAMTDLDRALTSLSEGNLAAGCATLQAVRDRDPTSLEASWAERIGQTINGLQPRHCTWVPSSRDLKTDGRTELILSQGISVPIWAALALPVYAPDSSSPTSLGLMILGGLGAGIGGTYLAVHEREVSSGQALMFYTGELLGAWYGAWLEGALANEFTGRPAHVGYVVGGVAGFGAAMAFRDASAGDVALVRSGALWGTALGGMIIPFVEGDDISGAFALLGGGTTVGLIATGALATQLELRRGQVNAINLGGYAGALTGGAVALMARVDDVKAVTALIGAGAATGLGIGSVLATRNAGGRTARLSPTTHMTFIAGADGRVRPGIGLSAAL